MRDPVSAWRTRLAWPRLTAPTMTRIPNPITIRLAIICPVTSSRAGSVSAAMSPKPTVANTVMVKYNASVRVNGSLKLSTDSPDVTV